MKRIFFKQAVLLFVMAVVVSMGQLRMADAAASIKFDATEVHLPGGEMVIIGTFTNYGNEGGTVTSAALDVDITDENGNFLWKDSALFSSVGVYVPAGGQHRHVFHIHNEKCFGYNGTIKWRVHTRVRF